MSVHGAADGNHLYTSPGNQQVPVGTTDIDILVVYAPPDGTGPPGVWVDAFNVDTGNFSDSLAFIQVLTPPTPPDTIDVVKTNFGNSDGEVSTVSPENVRAGSQVDGVPFVEWKKIVPAPATQNSPDVDLVQNESGEIWFAFYQTPTRPSLNLSRVIELMSAGIFLWTDDPRCGNGGHWVFPGHGGGPGPAPFTISVSKDIVARLSPEQRQQLETFATEYPAVAHSSLVGMTKTLGIIQGVNNLLASAES